VAARVTWRASVRVLALVAALGAGGCGAPGRPTPPAASATQPAPATLSPAVDRTRAAIERALGGRQVQLRDPQVPYRPAEAPAIAGVPRAVYQAVLPDDPSHGFIVVYDLPTEAAAHAAGEAQAAYVGSSVGRVQFPTGTQFVVRVVGSTAIFYAEPPDSPDDQLDDVAEALRTVGTEMPVPA
jgi:hypothetical protein